MGKPCSPFENKHWAQARKEAKRAGKKLNTEELQRRVEVLKQIACPMRVTTRRLASHDRFFKTIEGKYGLTRDDYLRLLHQQDSRCAVCKTELVLFSSEASERPVVDHDHATGKVRGLLCTGCNVRVGRVEFRAETDRYDAAKQYVLDSSEPS